MSGHLDTGNVAEGFTVRGRHGTLGVVVAAERPTQTGACQEPELVVIGGRSSLLRMHIPMRYVEDVSIAARTVDVDVDIADFTPRLADDGLVQLNLIG